MKGFFILCHNAAADSQINLNALDADLRRRNIFFQKNTPESNVYDNIVGYQLFSDRKDHDVIDDRIYISGRLYGEYGADNSEKLSYVEAVRFLSRLDLRSRHMLIEGEGAIASILPSSVVLQNDLDGYRKIFYFMDDNIFCATTRLPLMFAAIKKNWSMRKNALISYFCSRECKWPLTFINDVFVLPPQSRAIVTENGLDLSSIHFSHLYELKRIGKAGFREELARELRRYVLKTSAKNNAVALSGGHDSNSLMRLYKKLSVEGCTAVSLGYDSKRIRDSNIYDETKYAERAARELGVPFKRYWLSRDEFFSNVDDFIGEIDQPGHDPSSCFILSKYAKKDGFQNLVHGMGGDANFSSKKTLALQMALFRYAKKFGKIGMLGALAKRCSFRGPFRMFGEYSCMNHMPGTFYDVYERAQLFSSQKCQYVDEASLVELDEERRFRAEYFETLFSSRKTAQELYYSLALLTNPDEYHASVMGERNNIDISMPFTSPRVVTMIMNGSNFHRVTNREFEIDFFGVDLGQLAGKKSGLSIPYSEWMQPVSNDVFDFWMSMPIGRYIDFDSLRERYNGDEGFRNSLGANNTVWRLLVAKEYLLRNDLKMAL